MPGKKNNARTKQRKNKSGATRHAEKKFNVINWLILFVLIGIFVTFLIYLDKLPDSENTSSKSEIRLEATSKPNLKSDISSKSPTEQQFEFYTVLPDREVEVEFDEETEMWVKQPENASAAPTSAPTEGYSVPVKQTTTQAYSRSSGALYQLQVGAFKDLAKADTMKARLALMGVESNIYVVRNKNGQKMYRVRIGPNSDEKKLSAIQQQLKSQNINAILQKLKG